MAAPLISVVIPVFNRASTIARAIESVLAQSYKNFEIIVIDDGSMDETRNVVKSFQSECPQILYDYQNNSGPAAARNKGIKVAKGDFIAFLDSDDCWHAQKLEKQIHLFERHAELGFVHCWAEVTNPRGEKILRHPTYSGFVFEHLLQDGNFIATSAVLVKKSVFDQVGCFDEKLKGPEDFDMWLRIALRYKLGYVGDYLTKKYEQAGNCLQNNHMEMLENLQKVLTKHLGHVENPQKRRLYLAHHYRNSLTNFYDVPHIYLYCYKMIRTYPKILLDVKTYRTMLGFVKNSCVRHWLKTV